MYAVKSELRRALEGYPLHSEVGCLYNIFEFGALSGSGVLDAKGAVQFNPTNAPTFDSTLKAVNFGTAAQDLTGKAIASGAWGALGTKDFAVLLSARLNNAASANATFQIGDSSAGPYTSVSVAGASCSASVSDTSTPVQVTQATGTTDGHDFVIASVCDRDGNLTMRMQNLTTDTLVANNVTAAMTPSIAAATDLSVFGYCKMQKMYAYAAGLFIFNTALTAAQINNVMAWLMWMGAQAQEVRSSGSRIVRAHSGLKKMA